MFARVSSRTGCSDFAEQYPGEHRHDWKFEELPWYDGHGNLSFAAKDSEVAKVIKDWSDGED
eukprot:3159191-Karenia_brevis.AAC.1